MIRTLLSFALVAAILTVSSSQFAPSCSSPIYCQGDLLDTIQKARVFKNDSKTFVDLKIKTSVNETLENWTKFKETHPNATVNQLQDFVDANFQQGDELEDWIPDDFNPNPKLLARIIDPDVRNFTENLVQIWKKLARKIKPEVFDNQEQYSIIPVRNGFIVPGGRFREFYYWDSFWIIQGLIHCEMTETVKGMLENFIYLVKTIGFIPNGARVYYLNRSQPPLLTAMVQQYFKATQDVNFLQENVRFLDQELTWWLNNRLITFTANGNNYTLAHYDAENPAPRPESYMEDIKTAEYYKDPAVQAQVYCDLKSGAESGHDFSSRWIIDTNGDNNANLSSIHTRKIVPADLNAILSQAFRILSDFYKILGTNTTRQQFWQEKSELWEATIEAVLYDKEDGIWYDFNVVKSAPRKYFYASNFAPLWAEAYDRKRKEEYGAKAAEYLVAQNILDFQGGVPTSLIQDNEQWDFPNAWPPLQAFVVQGLKRTGEANAVDLAETLGKRWVEANMIGYREHGAMFEKYDAVHPGKYGGGGEYQVQNGFGWTNGVAFDFISLYYTN